MFPFYSIILFVQPAKYRRSVVDRDVDATIKDVCLEIAKRFQIRFLE